MAQYLIVHEDGSVSQADAKNMTAAATANLLNEETAVIYRLAGPGKQVTARVEQRRHIEVSDE